MQGWIARLLDAVRLCELFGRPGAPFFFKLKTPRNGIGGFGLVSHYARLPEWLVWKCFDVANRAPDISLMTRRLEQLRASTRMKGREQKGPPQIGCILLSEAMFSPQDLWVAQPSGWAPEIVRYKGYDLTVSEGLWVWRECQECVQASSDDVCVATPTASGKSLVSMTAAADVFAMLTLAGRMDCRAVLHVRRRECARARPSPTAGQPREHDLASTDRRSCASVPGDTRRV